jgi:histidyl-tRNA synthetase
MQPFRGTFDLLPVDARHHAWIISTARDIAARYGFGEITTPIFEYTEVFTRSLGETSDVVTKEMFAFTDRHGESLCLRPEGTAGVMRAVLSNKLTQEIPLKYFYAGPMFRYERPQKGRHRQFHQIGVEYIGESSAQSDAEVIAMADHILTQGFGLKNLSLQINTLGDQESRHAYRDILVKYLSQHQSKLSEESQIRLHKNPLRILDSKAPDDQEIVKDAPRLEEHLTEASQEHFRIVVDLLENHFNAQVTLSPRLVRGLDYYSHTVFEFVSDDLGAQSTVLAGGRYDQLSVMMGSPVLPSVGWAAGIERLRLLTTPPAPAYAKGVMIALGTEAESLAVPLGQILRQSNLCIEFAWNASLKSGLKKANKLQATYAIILGSEELMKKIAVVKNLETGEQKDISLETLPEYLSQPTRRYYGH